MTSRSTKKTLAVLGATGHQGGSVVDFVLNDPVLSDEYLIRALTRDPSSPAAKALLSDGGDISNIEVVQADVTDPASLSAAFRDVHTVFAVTTPTLGPDAVKTEYNTATLIADIAAEQGVQHFIWSTLPNISEASGGQYTGVTPFDAKAKAEGYIRGLAQQGKFRASFFAAGSYMENFQDQPFLAPTRRPADKWAVEGEEEWVLSRPCAPDARVPLIAAKADVGKFVGAILAEPDKYATNTGAAQADGRGRTLCAATATYSFEEVAQIASKATGKKIVYEQISLDQFRESLAGLPLNLGDIFVDAYAAYGVTGYFGKDAEEEVKWAVQQVRGKLATLEEFFVERPWVLE
ncbi:NmrA family NAD(P)-binding protein [Microdochium nivale]|nr:NmrA family NAD(P)-binding protein [Microdochium nivale]